MNTTVRQVQACDRMLIACEHGVPQCRARHARSTRMLHPSAGFTLIELLLALLISALLCAIAWPRFEMLVRKARRSEAQAALTSLLQAQARYRSTHRHYASHVSDLGNAPPLQHYELDLQALPKPSDGPPPEDPFQFGFVAVATPRLSSPQQHDSPCAELRLTLDGQQLTHTAINSTGAASGECWPQ